MSYYQRLLTEISLEESAVDCAKCTDLYKCCTYKPFIANFLVGNIGEALKDFDLKDWDLTICGIAPSLEYRKRFKGRSGWGFGTDASLLCTFYNKKSGGCNIWQNRPGVCRTFFCKSTYYEDGQMYWKSAEELTWTLEWLLLEDFLYEEGWTLEEVGEVKAYLHESAVEKKVKIPGSGIFNSLDAAMEFYERSSKHVGSLSNDYVEKLLEKVAPEQRSVMQQLKNKCQKSSSK